MVANFPIRNIMNRKQVQVVDEFEPVARAIELMDHYNISALPVKNNINKYIGVISKSDIASPRFLAAIHEKGTVDEVIIKSVMNNTVPLLIRDEQPVIDAIRLMHQRHIHRLFVVDEHRHLCGTLSSSDILRLLVVEKVL